MKIVNQSYQITRLDIDADIREIARGYCECYATKMPDTFLKRCDFIKRHRNHESPLEHSLMTVEFVTNRGVSHELVRHRLASYSQQSTRYCNYSGLKFGKELTFIENSAYLNDAGIPANEWLNEKLQVESAYFADIQAGKKPEEARGHLDNDLMTKILVSANYREWRHIFTLRCDKRHAHYQIRELLMPLLEEMYHKLPCIYDDIWQDRGREVLGIKDEQ